MLIFLSICSFGEPQVSQIYIFVTQKQKHRIDTLDMFSCLIKFLVKEKFIKYFYTMNMYRQHYQWFLIRSKEELNIKDGLTAIAKHIVETLTLHWKQLTNHKICNCITSQNHVCKLSSGNNLLLCVWTFSREVKFARRRNSHLVLQHLFRCLARVSTTSWFFTTKISNLQGDGEDIWDSIQRSSPYF